MSLCTEFWKSLIPSLCWWRMMGEEKIHTVLIDSDLLRVLTLLSLWPLPSPKAALARQASLHWPTRTLRLLPPTSTFKGSKWSGWATWVTHDNFLYLKVSWLAVYSHLQPSFSHLHVTEKVLGMRMSLVGGIILSHPACTFLQDDAMETKCCVDQQIIYIKKIIESYNF